MAFSKCDQAYTVREGRHCFPLKKCHSDPNSTCEGIERAVKQDDPSRSLECDQSVASRRPQFGVSKERLMPSHPRAKFDAGEHDPNAESESPPNMPAYVDSLGCEDPADICGDTIQRICSPFGVTSEKWKGTGRKQKGEYVEAVEGAPPTIGLASKWASTIRDERLEERHKLERDPTKEIPTLPPPVTAPPAASPTEPKARRSTLRCRHLNSLTSKPRSCTRTLALCGDRIFRQ